MSPEWEGREQSILFVLLKMFVNGSSTHLRTTTKMLILKVSIWDLFTFTNFPLLFISISISFALKVNRSLLYCDVFTVS